VKSAKESDGTYGLENLLKTVQIMSYLRVHINNEGIDLVSLSCTFLERRSKKTLFM
jgi:hypothetical protein